MLAKYNRQGLIRELAIAQVCRMSSTVKRLIRIYVAENISNYSKMSIDWSMAAVVTALVIFIVPAARNVILNAIETIRRRQKRILIFNWTDIPAGKCHDCPVTSSWHNCYHAAYYERNRECWSSTSSIGVIFNRAWMISQKKPRYMYPASTLFPNKLPVDLLCTDSRTILAFILCTVEKGKDIYWIPNKLCYGTTRVTCEAVGGHTICHVEGSFQS